MANKRCPHFSISVEETPIPGLHDPFRAPVYRCAVSESLLAEVSTLAGELTTDPHATLGNCPNHSIGPDGRPVLTYTCNVTRLRKSCRRGAVAVLREVGLDGKSNAVLRPEGLYKSVSEVRQRAESLRTRAVALQLESASLRAKAGRTLEQAARLWSASFEAMTHTGGHLSPGIAG